MNRYFFNVAILLTKNSIFNWMCVLSLIALITLPSYAQTENTTTVVVEKDVFPKINERKQRQIKGKNYVFATINGKKGMVALAENFLSEMAQAAGVEVTDFLEWNDLNPTDAIKTGQVYFLEKKNTKAQETVTHVLMRNETLWDVSQKYAIRYKYLLKYNRLEDADKVKTGLVVWLQTKRPKNVPVEVKDVTPIVATFEEKADEPADPELMAEWEELKKTELSGLTGEGNKNTSTTTSTASTTNSNDNTSSTTENTTVVSTDNKEETTQGVLVEDKTTTTESAIAVKYHVVQEGESLYDIAKKYNVMMSTLKNWNNLPDYTTYTGQKLAVSQPSQKDKTITAEGSLVTTKTEQTTNNTNANTNTVANTNTNGKTIIKAQNPDGTFTTLIDSSGVLLPMPEDNFTPIAPFGGVPDYHIIQKDETLWSIARKYNLSPAKLIVWNGYVKGDNIDVGTKIVLKESLAYPAGSRETLMQNSSSGASQSNSTTTGGTTTFQDPAVVGGGTTTTQDTSVKKPTREEILANGGDPDKAGTPGYDVMGFPTTTPITGADGTTITTVQETEVKTYVIQPKDMLSKIAQRFNTTTKDLIAWNPKKITPEGGIFKGDTIFVAAPKATVEKQQTTSNTVYPPEYYGAGYHAVQPNESIYEISDKYDVTMASIRKWNNLEATAKEFPVGTKLIVNETVLTLQQGNKESSTLEEHTTTALQYNYHTVNKGETLFSIASKYGISTAQLREWNNRQGDLVYDGEKLVVGVK